MHAVNTSLALYPEELTNLETILPPARPRRHRDIITWSILKRDWLCIVAYLGGICIILACFGFALWLASRLRPCQEWQVNDPMDNGCTKSPLIKIMLGSRHGTTQSVVSFINSMGLMAVCFLLYRLSQTLIWPVLQQKDITIAQLDQYISASGGKLLSLVRTAPRVRGQKKAALSIFCCALLAMRSQVGSLIRG